MKIHVQLTTDPIPLPVPPNFSDDGLCGSEIEFHGKVRSDEKGRCISGLHYEAYEAMATREMERLILGLSAPVPCLSVEVIHRLGWVPVNEASLYIRIRSSHRREGLHLLGQFLDLLKQEVPIWKSAPTA